MSADLTMWAVVPDRGEPTADGKAMYVYFTDRNGSEWEALVPVDRIINVSIRDGYDRHWRAWPTEPEDWFGTQDHAAFESAFAAAEEGSR